MSKHACELNFLSRSDGSALYSCGNTVALASVNGPGDVKKSNRLYNKAHLEVRYNPTNGQSMIGERALESILGQTVGQVVLAHLHPRTAICVTIQEMQSDGLALSTSVNAACMALLDAGVQMRSTLAAVTCCVASSGAVIIEPTQAQIEESSAKASFVFEGKGLKVLSVHQEGRLEGQHFTACLSKCQTAARDILAFYRRVLEEKFSVNPS